MTEKELPVNHDVPSVIMEKAIKRAIKNGIVETKVRSTRFRFEDWESTGRLPSLKLSAAVFYDHTDGTTLDLGRVSS